MATTLNTTHEDLYTDIRKYLLSLFPDCEVIRGYSNNVPLPKTPFMLMNIINETDLNTNIDYFHKTEGIGQISRSVEVAMQIDFYGESSSYSSRVFANLWRDYHACSRLERCQPLYIDPPKYLPLSNEYAEFEQRWMVTAYMTYNPIVTYEQDFVSEATIILDNL